MIQDTYFEAGTSDMSAYEGSKMQERDEDRRKLNIGPKAKACDHSMGFHYSRDDATCIGCNGDFSLHAAGILDAQHKAKPPLGIKPRYLWDEERGADLARAIGRHLDQGSLVQDDWLVELNDIVQRLNTRIAAKAGPG